MLIDSNCLDIVGRELYVNECLFYKGSVLWLKFVDMSSMIEFSMTFGLDFELVFVLIAFVVSVCV